MTSIQILSKSPGLAAIFGAFVGALGSSTSTWIAQKHQDRRDLLAKRSSIARSCIRISSGKALASWLTPRSTRYLIQKI